MSSTYNILNNVNNFFCFLGLVFLRKKKKGFLYIDVLLHWVIVENETLNNIKWFCCSKQNRYFKNVLMIIRLKYFHESQNIIVMLPPGREFFCAKCAQFPLKLNDEHFSSRAVIIHFWDRPYPEMNFKSHLNAVILFKSGKMSDWHMSR